MEPVHNTSKQIVTETPSQVQPISTLRNFLYFYPRSVGTKDLSEFFASVKKSDGKALRLQVIAWCSMNPVAKEYDLTKSEGRIMLLKRLFCGEGLKEAPSLKAFFGVYPDELIAIGDELDPRFLLRDQNPLECIDDPTVLKKVEDKIAEWGLKPLLRIRNVMSEILNVTEEKDVLFDYYTTSKISKILKSFVNENIEDFVGEIFENRLLVFLLLSQSKFHEKVFDQLSFEEKLDFIFSEIKDPQFNLCDFYQKTFLRQTLENGFRNLEKNPETKTASMLVETHFYGTTYKIESIAKQEDIHLMTEIFPYLPDLAYELYMQHDFTRRGFLHFLPQQKSAFLQLKTKEDKTILETQFERHPQSEVGVAAECGLLVDLVVKKVLHQVPPRNRFEALSRSLHTPIYRFLPGDADLIPYAQEAEQLFNKDHLAFAWYEQLKPLKPYLMGPISQKLKISFLPELSEIEQKQVCKRMSQDDWMEILENGLTKHLEIMLYDKSPKKIDKVFDDLWKECKVKSYSDRSLRIDQSFAYLLTRLSDKSFEKKIKELFIDLTFFSMPKSLEAFLNRLKSLSSLKMRKLVSSRLYRFTFEESYNKQDFAIVLPLFLQLNSEGRVEYLRNRKLNHLELNEDLLKRQSTLAFFEALTEDEVDVIATMPSSAKSLELAGYPKDFVIPNILTSLDFVILQYLFQKAPSKIAGWYRLHCQDNEGIFRHHRDYSDKRKLRFIIEKCPLECREHFLDQDRLGRTIVDFVKRDSEELQLCIDTAKAWGLEVPSEVGTQSDSD